MLLPEVVGCKLTGELNQWVTITDLALTITKVYMHYALRHVQRV